jgi:hypothetical protein
MTTNPHGAGRRLPLTHVLRARCSKVTTAEVADAARAEKRTESDMTRVLVEEALAARARGRR